jgi:Ni/Co efflux regulator RcnB
MRAFGLAGRVARLALITVLISAVGVGVATAQPGQDRRDDNRGQDNGNHKDQGNHGNGNNGNHGNPHDQGNNFQFRDQDRGNFQSHYSKDVNRWRQRPQGRPQFTRGQRVPSNYRFQTVPQSYYRDAPPPPAGYRYGYYDGYVVAYNPTTRIIADVLDLVGAATSR